MKLIIFLSRVLCRIRVIVSQLRDNAVCLTFHLNNQTDKGDETGGLEMEGLEMKRYEVERMEKEGVKRLYIV